MSFDPGAERLHSLRTAIISLAASPCRTWRQKLTALRANQEVVLGQTIRIDDLVDDQKIGWFNLNLLFWLFLALFADGYDISVMPFAMPTLSTLWHVDSGHQGYVFTSLLIGMLVGSPLLGSIGDRYGRKAAILLGSVIYGVTTLAVIWQHGYSATLVLRFCTGIGIGGLMPNTIALNRGLDITHFRLAGAVPGWWRRAAAGGGLPVFCGAGVREVHE
jgi:MFS family permease